MFSFPCRQQTEFSTAVNKAFPTLGKDIVYIVVYLKNYYSVRLGLHVMIDIFTTPGQLSPLSIHDHFVLDAILSFYHQFQLGSPGFPYVVQG